MTEKRKDSAIYCFGTGKTHKLKASIYAIRDAINLELQIGIGKIDYYPNQEMHLEAGISILKENNGFVLQYSFEKEIWEMIERVKGNLYGLANHSSSGGVRRFSWDGRDDRQLNFFADCFTRWKKALLF